MNDHWVKLMGRALDRLSLARIEQLLADEEERRKQLVKREALLALRRAIEIRMYV